MILAGRALSGIGVGLGVPSTAIYVAECSSPTLRGKLSSLPAFLMAFGVLIGYVFGGFVSITMWSTFDHSRNNPPMAPPGLLLLYPSSPAGPDHDVLARHSLLPGQEGPNRESSKILGMAERDKCGSCQVVQTILIVNSLHVPS